MAEHAEGTFKVTSWDENTTQELDGKAKVTRAVMTFAYAGGIEGESRVESAMYYRDDGTAVYTGLEHVTGRIAGRSGSFVVKLDGTWDGTEVPSVWEVVAGSGTGDLRGTGTASAESGSEGRFTLDYEFG
jgi:hypothetical protein